MDSRVEIHRNPTAFRHKFIIFSISYLLLSVLVVVMLFILSPTLKARHFVDILVCGFIAAALYSAASTLLWNQWLGLKYFLSANSLFVRQKVGGLFGRYNEKIYTLDSIKSAEIRQNRISLASGYGDVVLNIQHSAEQVVLQDIMAPEKLASQLGHSMGVTKVDTKN
jgi:hypothetical protein